MKKILCGLFLVAAVGLAAPSCVLNPADYTDITSNPGAIGCSVGGLTFSNFAVNSLNPSNMTVGMSISAPAGSVELDFQIAGFVATFPAPPPDLRISYQVAGPSMGVNNTFNAATPGVTIIETVCDYQGITAGGGSCIGASLGQIINNKFIGTQTLTFASIQSDIWIIKDITGSYFDTNGTIGISDFTNSNETSTVPEPMTLSMMGVGLLGLSLISRRKKS